jgi:hypothetical protein
VTTRARTAAAAAIAVLGLAAGARRASAQAPGAGAPYDAAPAAADTLSVRLDVTAAREILALLSRPRFDAEAAKALEELPAVRAAIKESNRPAEVFERDLGAAFDEQTRITMFDFRRIREDRGRWADLLAMIGTRQAELTRLATNRARALLPSDRPVTVGGTVFLTFGLPGRADHVAVPAPEGSGWAMVADLARLLTDAQSSPPAEQIKHLSRLMAAEVYRQAWAQYRAGSPAWQKRDPALGQIEPLLRLVAETGPAAIYSVDENFFPLSVWLKQPMKEDIDELNRVADRLSSAEGDLDARMEIAAEIQKPDFAASVAGPAGAFIADGIIQVLGLDAYRAALAGGPLAFFEAYDKASQQKSRGLVPLSKAIRERLAAAAAPPPPHA